MNYDGLPDSIVRMLSGEEIRINTKMFTNDVVIFNSKDDVLTLLVHLGYLTYDFDSKTVRISNYEIMEQFSDTI